MNSRTSTLLEALSAWLLPERTPEPGNSSDKLRLFVLLPDGERQLIGALWADKGEYVFAYDDAFRRAPRVQPLAAFPDVDKVYRDAKLWTFFRARIPPVARQDVRNALERSNTDPADTLRVLARVARRSVANPYVLEAA